MLKILLAVLAVLVIYTVVLKFLGTYGVLVLLLCVVIALFASKRE